MQISIIGKKAKTQGMYHKNDHSAIKDVCNPTCYFCVTASKRVSRDPTANAYLMTSVNEAWVQFMVNFLH